jgi:hypothetical protein
MVDAIEVAIDEPRKGDAPVGLGRRGCPAAALPITAPCALDP